MNNLNELAKRFIWSIILAPLTIIIMYKGDFYVIGLVLAVVFLVGCEWQKLIEYEKGRIWYLVGVIYVTCPALAISYLAFNDNKHSLVFLTVIVIATDLGGYIFGKTLKGPKLCPKISPNKTYSGLIGGLSLACLIGYYMEANLARVLLLAFSAQLGDLLESAIKRRFGVDNSSNLIPGHGGIMDRIDSFVIASVIMVIFHKLG